MTPVERFEAIAERTGPRLLGYITRRVERPADAADILAEVLVVAWRRLEVVPRDDEEALRWLYGVARRALANHRRGELRRYELAARLRSSLETVQRSPETDIVLAVREALAALPPDDRELLTLVAWEGLSSATAGAIVGVAPAAARKRLERARGRLGRELAARGVAIEPGGGDAARALASAG